MRQNTRCGTGEDSRAATALAVMTIVCTGCLNTQSVAFEEQPAGLQSPAAACREAARSAGHMVIEVTDVREVSEGYWEARFVVDDLEFRNLLGCRHSVEQGYTEVVRLER